MTKNVDITQYRDQYARLAQCVLKQWEHDGKPDDFGYVDVENTNLGTWLEFWKDCALMDEKPGDLYKCPRQTTRGIQE